jgi:hypothetical protein
MPIAICPAPNGITPAATKPEYHVVTGRSATDSTVVLSLFLLRVRAAVVGPSLPRQSFAVVSVVGGIAAAPQLTGEAVNDPTPTSRLNFIAAQ